MTLDTSCETREEDTFFPEKLQSSRNNRESRLSAIKVGKVSTQSDRLQLEQDSTGAVIWPWNKNYKTWWGFTVACALVTVITETYAVSFSPAGMFPYGDPISIIEYVLVFIFLCDIFVNFYLVYYDENDNLVTAKRDIAVHYAKGLLWLDLAGIFPFYTVALAITGELGSDSSLASYLSLLRLVKLVRLHRMKQLFDILQYNPRVSLLMLTLLRNFGFAILWSHFAACIFYFIARQYDFDPEMTWIGGAIDGLNDFERYVTSMYWSVVTFTTVGYGDYSPTNPVEQIWAMCYMLLNMVAHAWIIGSITLLIVKQDEKTGAYRESIQTLNQYAKLHCFPKALEKKLRTQLRLDFNNREISDEHVLANFPAETRRKVLRRLYLPSLMQASLMKGIRQQFVDAFLTTCQVEIFSSGEEILQRGSISSDLYLLVAGRAHVVRSTQDKGFEESTRFTGSQYGGTSIWESRYSEKSRKEILTGEFINAISFFTESPQMETVTTKTVCKTLTMPRTTYKMIAEDHPGSVGSVLQNLLEMVERMTTNSGKPTRVNLPTSLSILKAGSVFMNGGGEMDGSTSEDYDYLRAVDEAENDQALTAVKDLVKMHMSKLKDDHTTRFLFAASRGDTDTISLMCDQGFDPNSADYDQRTALMVAAMKGNTEAVTKILDYSANPNLTDMHGSTALYEAARNGHDDTMNEILNHGGRLCMSEDAAASKACQAVFDGDMLTLKRLLKAGLPVDAGDYDRRRAGHIAAAEGNIAAMKLLVEFGADINVKDRWGNSIKDEAKRVGAGQLVKYLESLSQDEVAI